MSVLMKEDQTISDLFCRQAERTPSRLAVWDDQEALTYRQLASVANYVARNILAKTGDATARICILAPQNITAVAGLLGVLKAGKCFVPMLPQDSDDYLRHLWNNSDSSLIFCGKEDVQRAAGICGNANLIVVATDALEHPDVCDSAWPADPERISALMYTSGSMGQPKGVLTTERAILERAMQHIEMARITPDDRQVAVVPWQFSSAFPDIYAPLLTGAGLYLYDSHRLGIERLALRVKQNAITLLKLPAALVRRFAESSSVDLLTTVRYVHCGGGVKVQDAKKLLDLLPDHAVLMHGFASTETNLVTQRHWWRDDPIFQMPSSTGILPAGCPVAGKKIQIVDDEGRPLEPGAEGELVVISRQAFRGYWNAPALTSQCLKTLPDSEFAYHTGDLGRIRPDGGLEIIGRKGHRVKIRGLRIDFGAVESLLLSLPYIKAVAVTAYAPSDREAQLAAYLETAGGDSVTTTRLRDDLKKMIPGYMIPSRFILMEALPRKANGKIDRNALPAPGRQRPPLANPYEPPRTELENLLADIWADVLDIDEVGIFDHFLELGGDSLLAVEMEMKLEREFDNIGPVSRFLQVSTIAQMAEMIATPERLRQVTREVKLPLRSRIKSLRHRLKRGDIDAPRLMTPFLPSYDLFIRLQKFWLSLPPVRSILKEKTVIFKEWLALTGQTDDSGDLMFCNLMANTWAIGRNILITQKKSMQRWVSIVGWQHVKQAAEKGQGVILVFPHSHLFLTGMRDKLILQLFPESYHLRQSNLAPGKAAKTAGLAGRFKQARDVLKRGGAVFLAGDGQQGKEKMVLTRYGRRFPFRGGAAELSVQTGAPMIAVFPSLRPNGGVEVEFLPPLIQTQKGSRAARTEDLLKQYAETYVDRWPQMLPSLRTGRQLRRLKDLA